jgi:prepilin-type N-terminal cleavage/methylation domain-containing protein/prepilin-type processing-associated H-X9-DG protein
MKTEKVGDRGGFTLVELLVVIAIIALLMAILLPALSKARTQAKRIVCLSGEKQLVTAWMAYADNFDGKIVNGGQPPSNGNVTEPYWCTSFNTPTDPGYDWSWKLFTDYAGILTYEQRVEKLKKGAIYRYCQNVKSYRCPEADKDMHRTYIIHEALNAYMTHPYHTEGQIIRRIGQIRNSKERVVFFEEKRISPDAFMFPYTGSGGTPFWDSDLPNIMHGNGANFAFADGHAEYHQWECASTIELCKKDPATVTGAMLTAARDACPGNKDGRWVHNAIWGE